MLIPRPGFMLSSVRSLRLRPGIADMDVDAVLAAFARPRRGAVRVPRDASRSPSVIVDTPAGPLFLKAYKPTVRDEAIVHEHSILVGLAAAGFPSSVHVVATPGGQTVVRHEGRRFALFDYVDDGFHYYMYLFSPGRRRSFVARSGELLARLHQAMARVAPLGSNWIGIDDASGRRERDAGWYAERLDRSRRASLDTTDPVVRQLLGRTGELGDLLAALEPRLEAAGLERQTVHGDFGPHNVLFRSGAPPVVLDFEIARLDWRGLEVVNALGRFCFDGRFGARLPDMAAFLGAYQATFALPDLELALLPDLWRFSHGRRVISNWDLLCREPDRWALWRIRRHLALLDWMSSGASRFRSIVPGSAG